MFVVSSNCLKHRRKKGLPFFSTVTVSIYFICLLGLGGSGSSSLLCSLLGLGGVDALGNSGGLGEDGKTSHGALAEVRTELVLDDDVVESLGVVLEAGALAEVHDLGGAGGLLGLEVGELEGDDVVLLRDGETLSGEATVSVGGEVSHVAGLGGEGDAVAGVTESVVLANKLPDEISGHFFVMWLCVCGLFFSFV